mgnify:CR=1 FL=1
MDLTHVYATVWSDAVRIAFELNGVDAMRYPLEVTNLTFHKCMVSSLHTKNDQQVIQAHAPDC